MTHTKKTVLVYTIVVIASISIALMCRFIFGITIIFGNSMYPTLENRSLATRTLHFEPSDIKRGVVVTCSHDNELVKRVVAIPGDKVAILNGEVYVNGKKEILYIGEDILSYIPILYENSLITPEIILGENEYYLLGDNRNHSSDSHIFGPVRFEDINGINVKPIF